jgi:UDP-N-acetylmuramate dehydrogenase
MNENLNFRKAHQPSLALPNCGSIFRNPKNNSAGKLLDECDVKGLKVGGVKVWENHANFIVNYDNGTSQNVLDLMREMKKRVKEKFDIELVPEIRYLGKDKL